MAGVRVQGTMRCCGRGTCARDYEMLWQGFVCKGLRCCGRGTCARDYEMLWQGYVCKGL